MPREFSRSNWPQEEETNDKQIRAWTAFFTFFWGSLFLTASFWLTFWVLESESVIDWMIPWWKCGILSYCFLIIFGMARIGKRQQ
jgi:hypothetical protein